MVCSCVYSAVAYSGSPPAFSFRVREESGGGGREGEDRGWSRLWGLFNPVCTLTILNALVFSLRLVTNIWNNFSECTVTPKRLAFRGLSYSFNPVKRILLPPRTSTVAGYYDITSEPMFAQTDSNINQSMLLALFLTRRTVGNLKSLGKLRCFRRKWIYSENESERECQRGKIGLWVLSKTTLLYLPLTTVPSECPMYFSSTSLWHGQEFSSSP